MGKDNRDARTIKKKSRGRLMQIWPTDRRTKWGKRSGEQRFSSKILLLPWQSSAIIPVEDRKYLGQASETFSYKTKYSRLHNKRGISIELIDIEGSRREVLEAFWKSPYLNVTYCIDLKIGTWPLSIYFLLLDYLILYKNQWKVSAPPICHLGWGATQCFFAKNPISAPESAKNKNTKL